MTILEIELIRVSPFEPSDDLIVRQLGLLSEEIDRLNQPHQETKRDILAGQYRALMWARSPNGFCAPIQDPLITAKILPKQP